MYYVFEVHIAMEGSQSKYKCSIIQKGQNTTPKYKRNKIQTWQNAKYTKYKHNKIQNNKIQMAKIQM